MQDISGRLFSDWNDHLDAGVEQLVDVVDFA
jgi:hypothetical protein